MEKRTLNGGFSRREFLKTAAVALGASVLSKTSAFGKEAKKQTPELSSRASQEEIISFIEKNKQEVDYRKIWLPQYPILSIGEYHTVFGHKDEVIRNIPIFKKLGLTHVAMEMLREEHQPLVDAYFGDKSNGSAILEVFKKRWDKKPGMAEKYMEMVTAIKAAGIKLLAIDLYSSGPEYFTSEFFRKRNNNWARIILGVLKVDKKARVLTYNGGTHSLYNLLNDSINGILKSEYGISSTVVALAGAEIPTDDYLFEQKVAKAAQTLKIDKSRFSIKMNQGEEPRSGDWIVHLPQTEKALF